MARLATFVIELSEADFQTQVTQLADDLGWQWMHVVTTGTGRNYPIRGSMGRGWPDLTLCRRGRLIFAELKREKGGLPTAEQIKNLSILGDVPGVECHVWRPSQLALIAEILT